MTAMTIGMEWLIDGYGCRADALRDLQTVRRVCEDVVAGLNLRVVGEPVWHQFPPPGGVTGMYLLMESHLTCHTYPEHRVATFNLYCCRPRPAWFWQDQLAVLLGASDVTVRSVGRICNPSPRLDGLQIRPTEDVAPAEAVKQGRGDA